MADNSLSSRLKQAAHNNAAWCEAVCRAHGIPGRFEPGIWLNRNPTPPYYPNAVTLVGKEGIAQQMNAIRRLVDDGLLTGAGVKDSFNLLDLAPLGFRVLFEAMWIWRTLSLPQPMALTEDIRWVSVSQPDELARWEQAWAALPADEQLAADRRIFLPSLLADPDVVFIAAYRDQQIVAGAIGNRTGDVVGLSNQFAPEREAGSFAAGCLALLMDIYPRLPIVGYERGDELVLAKMLGFDEIGPLRVWTRAVPAT